MNQSRSAATPIVLFPGLGADERLFDRQRREVGGVIAPRWIPHRRGESLRSYAARMVAGLGLSGPVVLGGVSMGGMIALEAARHVETVRVILIASCRGAGSVSRALKVAERCGRLLPAGLMDRGRVMAGWFVGRGGAIGADDRRLLARMARELPIDFLRWGARAIVEWEGCEDPGVPVHHIHGDRDWVIPVRGVRPDVVVARGCHVLNLSHPAEVNRFIVECVSV